MHFCYGLYTERLLSFSSASPSAPPLVYRIKHLCASLLFILAYENCYCAHRCVKNNEAIRRLSHSPIYVSIDLLRVSEKDCARFETGRIGCRFQARYPRVAIAVRRIPRPLILAVECLRDKAKCAIALFAKALPRFSIQKASRRAHLRLMTPIFRRKS